MMINQQPPTNLGVDHRNEEAHRATVEINVLSSL